MRQPALGLLGLVLVLVLPIAAALAIGRRWPFGPQVERDASGPRPRSSSRGRRGLHR